MSAPAASITAAPRQDGVRAALWIFVGTLAGCLALYALLTAPGSWFPGAADRALGARDFALVRGSGGLERDSIVITAMDATGVALLSANTDFRAVDYPLVAWSGDGFPDGADVRFLWRTDYAPGKLNSVPVSVAAGRLLTTSMAGKPDWAGRITGVALAVHAQGGAPLRVQGMEARTGGIVAQVRDRFREWFAFEPWSGSSINTVAGGADVQELPLPTFVVVALALAVAVWFVLAWRAHRAQALPVVLALLFVASWLILDAQWSFNLARQVAQTHAQYGGKDWRDGHLAAEDAPLFRFIEKARAKLPATPARVFVVADASYFRSRAAYHLYPHNVYFDPRNNTLPAPGSLHQGDYVLVYQRRGVQYSAEERKLRFEGGDPIPAEALVVESGGALFRIL